MSLWQRNGIGQAPLSDQVVFRIFPSLLSQSHRFTIDVVLVRFDAGKSAERQVPLAGHWLVVRRAVLSVPASRITSSEFSELRPLSVVLLPGIPLPLFQFLRQGRPGW